MVQCALCLDEFPSRLTVIGDMAFCNTCYTKVKRLVRNYVKLKHVRRNINTDKYIDARKALEDSLRK